MQKIILDTDIGTDVDDALALALIVSDPDAQLLGVSTVHGDTPRRADVARELAAAFGYDVPVAPGIGDVEIMDGPALILGGLRSHPDARLVSIGPLTNLAACVRRDPEAMRAAHITIMGGILGCAFCEGNIATDPEAADIVLSCGADMRLVTLDVTLTADFPFSFVRRLGGDARPGQSLLHRFIMEWRDGFLEPFYRGQGKALGPNDPFSAGLHDPMAVAAALHPDWFAWRPAQVLVELHGKHTRGVTVDHKNVFTGHIPAPNCLAAQAVDAGALMGWIEERLLAKPEE